MSGELHQVFVGMGSNLGDRLATLTAAVDSLARSPEFFGVETSSIYETNPVGELDQPMFLNLVVGFKTTLSPEGTLEKLLEIEKSFGRVRDIRWGPRSLDLDLLVYQGRSHKTSQLTLPHPRMFERAFVVVPFRELLKRPQFDAALWNELRSELDAPLSLNGVSLYRSL